MGLIGWVHLTFGCIVDSVESAEQDGTMWLNEGGEIPASMPKKVQIYFNIEDNAPCFFIGYLSLARAGKYFNGGHFSIPIIF